MDGDSFLTWNNNNVSVNGVNIFESGNENIVNVIINPQKTKPEAVIITENSQNTLNYTFQLLKDDQISFIHSLEKEYDGALPKLLFTKNNLLMLLPETQQVTIFDSNGSLSGEFDLFEERPNRVSSGNRIRTPRLDRPLNPKTIRPFEYDDPVEWGKF